MRFILSRTATVLLLGVRWSPLVGLVLVYPFVRVNSAFADLVLAAFEAFKLS